jgi:hypothetical protein
MKITYGRRRDGPERRPVVRLSPRGLPLVLWGLDDGVLPRGRGYGGAAVQWLRDGLGLISDPAAEALATSVPDSGGAWCVPAFRGLGTPISTSAPALIGGLSRGTAAPRSCAPSSRAWPIAVPR